MSGTIGPRSIVKAYIGKKWRHAVVLGVSPEGKMIVVVGYTGSHFEDHEHICVERHTRFGRALQLSKDTYFYPRNLKVRHIDEVELIHPPDRIKCPPRLFRLIETLCLGSFSWENPDQGWSE